MKPTIWQRLDVLARQLTPLGITFALVILNAVPLHVPALARVVPVLPLMAVYHFAIYRPVMMPMAAVFLIGVFHDLLTGFPLGVHALVFVSVFGILGAQRRFFMGKSFAIYWLGFALAAFGGAVETWVLMSGLNATLMETRVAFFQYVMTVGTFPILAWILLLWQQAFQRAD